MGKLVNKKELAEIFGKSEATLTTWQKNGLPIKLEAQRGQSNQYDCEDCINWLVRREIGKLTVDDEGRVHDYDKERARLTHHQANKTELEEAVLRGTLIPSETVERVQGDMVSSFRSKILSIPTKAAHALIGLEELTEAKDVIKQYLFEALNELADYRPSQYRSDETMVDDFEDGSAAAGANG